MREAAQLQGFTVVDCASVAATHFSHVLHTQAARLLGRQEAQGLLDHLAKSSPKLVEDLVPKLLTLSTVQRVLQNLLEDSIPVRDLRTILETLAELAPRTQDAGELTAAVRASLGPAIVQHVFGATPEIGVLVLEPDLERVLLQSSAAADAALEPGLADTLARQVAEAAARREALGEPAALVVSDRLRPALARLLRRAAPQLKVLGHAEIPDSKTLRVHAVIGARP
jgi:flagellar biosynthesis protein FlhA